MRARGKSSLKYRKMNYEHIRQNAVQFLALTSLTVEEFDYLLEHFAPRWHSYYRYHTLEGKRRKHPLIKEAANAKLKGTAQKLFFLLVYLKNNSLQQQQAASFGVSQAKVSIISRLLLEILNQTLKSMGLLPCRNGLELAHRLANHPDKVFSLDGTERSIQRNKDADAQEVEYSGKKGSHNIKNNLLCDDSQYIHYLSYTAVGSTHDITLARQEEITLPDGSVVRIDLGYLGLELAGEPTIEIPFKKPKGQELSFSQKLYNKMLSGTRVVVEHANSGVKRLRMLKDTIRIRSTQFRDSIMVVACGLHNLRVKSSQRNYQASHAGI